MKNEKLNCVLVKRQSNRGYLDLFLVWSFDNRVFYQRIKPSFKSDYKYLLSHAQLVDANEPFEKYV